MKKLLSLLIVLLMLIPTVSVIAVSADAQPTEFPFIDVPSDRWSRNVIAYSWLKDYMNGVSDTSFAPAGKMTRAMTVTVLYRLEGSPEVIGTSVFTDVKDGTWYTDAVIWAEGNKIVNGISATSFAPGADITREQLVAILYRFAAYRGEDTATDYDLSPYTDNGKIGSFAKDAFAWAVGCGLVNGMTADTLAPKGNATREQFAAVLFRFDNANSEKTIRVINDKIYVQTFSDDFDGDSLDPTKWTPCPEWVRQDVGGRWDDDMISVKDGNLVLTAAIEDGNLLSGAVQTQGLFEQCRGYFEASIKFQNTTGFWGAFWLLGPMGDKVYGNGAIDGCEIDVIESYDYKNKYVNLAMHWDGYGEHHESDSRSLRTPGLYDGNFHTYAVEWTDTEYKFYIDGVLRWTTTTAGPCETPLYMLLTTEFGTWAGRRYPEQLPDCIEVDYVRAYQLDD